MPQQHPIITSARLRKAAADAAAKALQAALAAWRKREATTLLATLAARRKQETAAE